LNIDRLLQTIAYKVASVLPGDALGASVYLTSREFLDKFVDDIRKQIAKEERDKFYGITHEERNKMDEQVQETVETETESLPPPPDQLAPEVRDAVADVKLVSLPDQLSEIDAARLDAEVHKQKLCLQRIETLKQQTAQVQAQLDKHVAVIKEYCDKYQIPMDGSCTFDQTTGKITRPTPIGSMPPVKA
jgi:hypothetical protein